MSKLFYCSTTQKKKDADSYSNYGNMHLQAYETGIEIYFC